MAKPQYVKMEKDGVEGQCLPQSLNAWKRNGWTVVDDGDSGDVEESYSYPPPPPEGDDKTEETI